jgi:hypothetical protein
MVKIHEILEVDINEAISRDHQKIAFNVEVVHGTAENRRCLAVVEGPVEVPMIGNTQSIEEASPALSSCSDSRYCCSLCFQE